MTSFITGAMGFIGSHLVNMLQEQDEEVVALCHDVPAWTNWMEETIGGLIWVRGDVRDYQFLMRAFNRYRPEVVYHLAASAIVKTAHLDPINTYDINVMGTLKVLEACRQLEIPKVVVQSTDKVYGDAEDTIVIDPLIPTEPYGTSKVCADMIAQSYRKTYGMNLAITRPCNIYGYDLSDRIVPNTIRACLEEKTPIIYGQGGDQRQYLYVNDLCEVLIKIGSSDHLTGRFNIGGPDTLDQEQVVQKILKFFPDLEPTYIERPEYKEISRQSLQTSPSIDWEPMYSFEQGIRATIAHFEEYGWK